ncbi:MAG: efflux RND transporter periplasmic adaptor subunit [Rhodanobacter sp.]
MKNHKSGCVPVFAPRSRLLRGMALASVALLTSVALGACSSRTSSPAPSDSDVPTASNVTLTKPQLKHIRIDTVSRSTFHNAVDTTGVVDFDNDQATAVLAPFSGPVTRLLVDVGDKVKKGQALATVDSPDFAAAIGAYRKAIVASQTARRLADLDKDMLAHQGISRREAEQAEADAVGAESDRDAAKQALLALNLDPKSMADVAAGRAVAHVTGTIRAPIDGTVVEKSITPGQLLQAGSTACFTVADLSRMWVKAQLYDSDVAAVRAGDSASISASGMPPLAGKVDNVSAIVDADTRSVVARVVVDNPDGLLKKQMYVRVQIQSKQSSSGVLVPVSAVLRNDENLPFVYAAQADGSFARRSVSLGNRVGDRYDIPSGLKAGDRIVVDGAIFVQFMQNQ